MSALAEQTFIAWFHTPVLRAGISYLPAYVPAQFTITRPTTATEVDDRREDRGISP
jgi:hypothetical protein